MSKEWVSIILIFLVIFIVAFKYLTKEGKVDESVSEDVPVTSQEPGAIDDNNISLDKLATKSAESTDKTNKQTMEKPKMIIDQNKSYSAILTTSEGDITIQLNAKETPVTVNNFVYLAKANFYNGTIFHRVIKGFMIQGGDPQGTGSGGPGYTFSDEPFSGSYTRGTVAMANAGPNTNGSQFFIMHQDYQLPPNYVIFGKVTDGMDVVDKIAEAPVTMGASGEPSKPVNPVSVKSVKIIEE
jgi:cyclophilin family peptidyl-prolyl cis-trans isomerase